MVVDMKVPVWVLMVQAIPVKGIATSSVKNFTPVKGFVPTWDQKVTPVKGKLGRVLKAHADICEFILVISDHVSLPRVA